MKNSDKNINSKKEPVKQPFSSTRDHLLHKGEKKTRLPTNEFVGPLLTDMYELTMLYSYWKSKKCDEFAVFDLFFRTNPFKGEFTIFAGLEETIRFVSNFQFSEQDIEYLQKEMSHCDKEFFTWLKELDCSQVKIYAIPEGTIVFPKLPLLRVEGPIGIIQILETTLLTLINFPSLIATLAARHRLAAGDRIELVEFGLRRAQGVDGGITASRYSYLGGYDSTSNVLASKLFGIPSRGTHAHSFVSSFLDEKDLPSVFLPHAETKEPHDLYKLTKDCQEELGWTSTNGSELVAFVAYALSFPTSFLALVDTYDTLNSGVLNFLCVAYALHKVGYKALGVRLDSGDLAYLSKETRKLFQQTAKKLKIEYFSHFKIMASSDLDEKTILHINREGHEINSFGVGTHLVTCKSQPALGCVYKLVQTRDTPRIKISQNVSKITLPGRKDIYRLYGQKGYPVVDLMVQSEDEMQIPKKGEKVLCRHPFDQEKRGFVCPTKVEPLLQLVWDCGKVCIDFPSLEEIRSRTIQQIQSMRSDHLRPLNPTPYKVAVSQKLYSKIHEIWSEVVPISEIKD